MKETKISGGNSKLGQAMTLSVNFLLVSLLFLIADSEEISLDEFIFYFAIFSISFLVIKNSFDFVDLFDLDNSFIVVKKIFLHKKIKKTDIKYIRKSLLPFSYYIEAEDKKYYFFASISTILSEVASAQPVDVLSYLRKKIMNV